MKKIILMLAWLLALSGLPGVSAAAGESYVFGVTPQFERRQLFIIWNPILKELEKRTGHSFELALLPDIPSFERGYNAGQFDFAYMNPYLVVANANPQGYLPLVRDGKPVQGILVVAGDSPIRTPADLDGKAVAFPAPNAIGASLLVRAELARSFKVRITPSYVKSHTAVYLNVAQGLADAGGGVQKTLDEQKDAVRGLLRVIHTTRPFPSHPVAAHPRVPAAVREAVQKALLDLAASPEGKVLLQEIPLARMIPTSARDYEPLRELGLEDFFVPER
ncbi:MAG: ABC-type phosphate/phosphonate transport system, periplasmic component [Rhodocyclaceae bacterium]|nr:ABC-type phosphate/phosphonate transport system, periplasmic component [Rhodocyclaceae bacterium]